MRRIVVLGMVVLMGSGLLVPSARAVPSEPAAHLRGNLEAIDADSATDVWAVGYQSAAKGHIDTLIQHWDGVSWSVLPAVNPGKYNFLYGVSALGPDDVWVVGSGGGKTLVEHWDGGGWTQVPSPSPGHYEAPALLDVTAISPTDVWAVGIQHKYDEIGPETLVEHWDGSVWTVVPHKDPDKYGSNRLDAVTASSASDVLAVGSADQEQLAERWNGASWKVEQTADSGSRLSSFSGVDAISSDDVWAVGFLQGRAGDTSFFEHYDGTNWHKVPSHTPPAAGQRELLGVSGDATDDVWAVGIGLPSDTSHTLAMHWDGDRWSRVPTPSPARGRGSLLVAVITMSPTDAWSVGSYSDGAEYHPLTEHWDGTAWTKVRTEGDDR